MSKNKTGIIFGIIFLIILFIGGGLTLYFLIGGEKPQSAIPSTCTISESWEGTSEFLCPSDASACHGKVWLECDYQTDTFAKVTARVKDHEYDEDGHWIVLRNEYDQLESWYEVSQVTATPPIATSNAFDLPYEWKGYLSTKTGGGTIFPILVVPNPRYFEANNIPSDLRRWNRYIYYKKGGAGNTNPEPIYNCQNREICSGTVDAYSCSQTSMGDVQVTISQSASSPWETHETFTLNPNKRIIWAGNIEATISKAQENPCTKNKENPNDPSSYFECKKDPSTRCYYLDDQPTPCPIGEVFYERDQMCRPPYNYEFNVDGTSFAVNSRVTGDFRIYETNDYQNIALNICIGKLGQSPTCITERTGLDGRGTYSLPPQAYTGVYEIYAEVKHPLGETQTKKYTIQYVEPFSFSMYSLDQNQNTGDVIVYAIVSDSLGEAKRDVEFHFDSTTCGRDNIANKCDYGLDKITDDGAQYKLWCTVTESCLVTFVVTAEDSTGYETGQDTIQINSETQAIIIQHANKEDFQMPDEGKHTFNFNIMDSNLVPISDPSKLIIQVRDRGGCLTGTFCNFIASPNYNKNIPAINPVPINKEQGRWKFDHTFIFGSNHIIIAVESYGLESNKYEEQFVFWECIDCVGTDPDPSDPDPTPKPSFDIGLIIAGSIVVLGLLTFFGIIFMRGKKKNE